MWIANDWKEYEVIDCSDGEKLERWGRYILLRPDPQVICGYGEKGPALAASERALSQEQKGRRTVGVL